jgi:hypothetical protein
VAQVCTCTCVTIPLQCSVQRVHIQTLQREAGNGPRCEERSGHHPSVARVRAAPGRLPLLLCIICVVKLCWRVVWEPHGCRSCVGGSSVPAAPQTVSAVPVGTAGR